MMFFDKLADMIEDLFAYLKPLSEYARCSDKLDLVKKVIMEASRCELNKARPYVEYTEICLISVAKRACCT